MGACKLEKTFASRKKIKWWCSDLSTEWRSHLKVRSDPNRQRIVKVKGHDDVWVTLSPVPASVILEWYDVADVHDVKENALGDDGRMYAYRFEGGRYVSQWDLSQTDMRPLEVQVSYGTVSAT